MLETLDAGGTYSGASGLLFCQLGLRLLYTTLLHGSLCVCGNSHRVVGLESCCGNLVSECYTRRRIGETYFDFEEFSINMVDMMEM